MKAAKLIIAFNSLFALFPLPSLATTNIEDTSITKILAHETDNSGTIYFKFESLPDSEPCTRPASVALTRDNVMMKEILSIALTAYTSKHNVSYTVEGCSASGNPRMKNLWIE
ncbi:hypothetical protein [Microbulbifer agarilyticus]